MLRLVICLCGLLALTPAARAEIQTWVYQPGDPSLTNTITSTQVIEFLSVSMDTDTAIDVLVKNQSVTFGRDGLPVPAPFAIAGPANIVVRHRGTTGQGAFFTVRISSTEPRDRTPFASR